jgi:hypothetical protein
MFVGMDVHRNRTQMCVMDKKGNEVRNHNLVNDRRALHGELGGLKEGTPVAFEAAYGTSWVAKLLADVGLEPHLAHPSGCRAIADAKLEYDRVDARTLASLVRAGLGAGARRPWRACVLGGSWTVGSGSPRRSRIALNSSTSSRTAAPRLDPAGRPHVRLQAVKCHRIGGENFQLHCR